VGELFVGDAKREYIQSEIRNVATTYINSDAAIKAGNVTQKAITTTTKRSIR